MAFTCTLSYLDTDMTDGDCRIKYKGMIMAFTCTVGYLDTDMTNGDCRI